MSTVQRLRLVAAMLALAAAITCSHVWGDAAGRRAKPQTTANQDGSRRVSATEDTTNLAQRFAEKPVISYQTTDGQQLFGAQIRVQLPPVGGLPRDLLVLIDTSASQAGPSYQLARETIKALRNQLADNDRLAIWTLNTPAGTRNLTKGFRSPHDAAVNEAIDRLERVEYCSGACDLKTGLLRALKEFDGQANRQQAVILLGDGESAYAPVQNQDRFQIGQEMVAQRVAFFAVPLGAKLNPMNLHGFASTTGGTIVRLLVDETAESLAKRVLQTVSAPVFYPTRHELGEGIVEAYPTRLPPLRADNPTLMVGRLAGTDSFVLAVEGTVAGKPHRFEVREPIAKPEVSNFFLTGVVSQWSKANNKSAPALLRADRALAYAAQQTELTREEYLTQAHWALSEDHFDVAEKLFALAAQVDPHDTEAAQGLQVVKRLKEGRLTRKQLLDEVSAAKLRASSPEGNLAPKADRLDLQKLLVSATQEPRTADTAQPMPQNNPPSSDLLAEERQRQILAEQQLSDAVDRAIKNARQLLNTDPDSAYNVLKRQLESVTNASNITDRVRSRLTNQLEGQMRDFEVRGRGIKQRLQEEEQRRILAARAAAAAEVESGLIERTRERVRAFTNLMDKARYEEAYKEANLLREESINNGRPVPIQATASYAISLNALNLKELVELKRIREERFLLTLMQTEKSHIPYPDEPPVHFPPTAAWKELTKLRSKRYGYYSFGPAAGENYTKVVGRLNSPMVPSIDSATSLPLSAWLERFRQNLEGTNFYIRPNNGSLEKGDVKVDLYSPELNVKIPAMPGASLGSVMSQVLGAVEPPLTYYVNHDHIEILKKEDAKYNYNFPLRVYEVADLIIPIPSAINVLGVGQNLAVLGGAASYGAAGSPFNAFGNTGAIGAFGGIGAFAGFGGLGGLAGGGLGGLGGLAGLGGGIAGLGGGAAGAGGFGVGGGGIGAAGQGGLLGFGGGQLGNLGAGFGFLGARFDWYLVQLIKETIGGARYWVDTRTVTRPVNPNPMAQEPDEDVSGIPENERFNIGYYPPALSLVVRAPSRFRPYVKEPFSPAAGQGGGAAFRNEPRRGEMGMLAKNADVKPAAKVSDASNVAPPIKEKKKDEDLARSDSSPTNRKTGKRVVTPQEWQEALAKNDIPPEHRRGVILAAADFLGQAGEFAHTAEILKGNLRLGIVNEAWVFSALAIALQQSGGSPEELERAWLSAIDLDPKDPDAYMQAAKAMAEAGEHERAITYCRAAASLRPGWADPYADALAYASKSKTVDSDVIHWAVSNLLGREWIVDKELLAQRALAALDQAKARLEAENRREEASRLAKAVAATQRRDLVVELSWAPETPCDLDLEVFEPINTTCSPTKRQSAGGGVLQCDDMTQHREVYTAAEGFSGTYVFRVKRVWGRPRGGTAQLKVVHHQGTENQHIEYHTIQVDQPTEVKVTLANGRRTHLAEILPPGPPPTVPDRDDRAESVRKAREMLRALADPLFRQDLTVRAGGVSPAGTRPAGVYDLANSGIPTARIAYESKVEGVEHIGVELIRKVEVIPSSGEIRVKVVPAFNAAHTLKDRPEVNLPLFPGGN
jgi:tetratricopeptide (TPR) repeat protein